MRLQRDENNFPSQRKKTQFEITKSFQYFNPNLWEIMNYVRLTEYFSYFDHKLVVLNSLQYLFFFRKGTIFKRIQVSFSPALLRAFNTVKFLIQIRIIQITLKLEPMNLSLEIPPPLKALVWTSSEIR